MRYLISGLISIGNQPKEMGKLWKIILGLNLLEQFIKNHWMIIDHGPLRGPKFMKQNRGFEVWDSPQHASNEIFCWKLAHKVPRALQKITSFTKWEWPPLPLLHYILQTKILRTPYFEVYHLPISVKFCNLFNLISRSRFNSPMFWSKPKKGWGVRNDKTNRYNNV